MRQHFDLRSLVAGIVAGACSVPACAAYTGVSVHLHTSVNVNGVPRDVYRVYANFNDPGDRVVTLFGDPGLGSLEVESRNSTDTGAGSAFYNYLSNSSAPTSFQIANNPNAEWDTFGTLGLAIADHSPYGDMTSVTPGFTGITGTHTIINNGAWYTVPTFDHDNNPATPEIPPPQTVAGWTGDGDPQLRILILQLTVNSGDNVRGKVNLGTYGPITSGSWQTLTNLGFQTFNSYTVPAPSALALLGLAGMAIARRRRGAA